MGGGGGNWRAGKRENGRGGREGPEWPKIAGMVQIARKFHGVDTQYEIHREGPENGEEEHGHKTVGLWPQKWSPGEKGKMNNRKGTPSESGTSPVVGGVSWFGPGI